MKGRFFPTYEYRLFIRHRPLEQPFDFVNTTYDNMDVRQDTVLMMAKNRGRKNSDNSGQASKKGSNNYYLTLPLQKDLNLHYKNVNGQDNCFESKPNGIEMKPDASEFKGVLGRLQSNFVGTEFQIFTPRSTMGDTKMKAKSSLANSLTMPHSMGSGISSDDEVLYDYEQRGEPKSLSTTRVRSRFGLLSLRGKSGDNRTEFFESFHTPPRTLHRAKSSDAVPRRNRKVTAAESFFESQNLKVEAQRTFFEVEDGAITYTANLLGSRPRIMDVCIPKVNLDGSTMERRQFMENYNDQDIPSSAYRLLNHLKQLQNTSPAEENGRPNNIAINDDSSGIDADRQQQTSADDNGLLALQNRPPWWNVELGSFVLNFGGRVSVASVKNFQLCDRNDQDHIMLQFGRIEGRHSFTMDFQYPLTAVQA